MSDFGDGGLPADYEEQIARAVYSAVIDISSVDGEGGVVNVGRAMDGILLGLSLVAANTEQAKDQRQRRAIADYARKRVLKTLLVANDVMRDGKWPMAKPIQVG